MPADPRALLLALAGAPAGPPRVDDTTGTFEGAVVVRDPVTDTLFRWDLGPDDDLIRAAANAVEAAAVPPAPRNRHERRQAAARARRSMR